MTVSTQQQTPPEPLAIVGMCMFESRINPKIEPADLYFHQHVSWLAALTPRKPSGKPL
jgi:hypothetical protein